MFCHIYKVGLEVSYAYIFMRSRAKKQNNPGFITTLLQSLYYLNLIIYLSKKCL